MSVQLLTTYDLLTDAGEVVLGYGTSLVDFSY